MIEAASLPPLQFLQLLADEQRWRILQELARSDRKVGELTQLLARPQNLVSYHLAGLRDAGIVTSRRSSADGRDTYYRADLRRCADLLAQVGTALQPGLRLEAAQSTALRGSRPRPRPTVLFLCTGNSARSQMAEGLLEHHTGGAVRARSAGSHPRPIHLNAVRVMAERGIDISGRKSKSLDRFLETRFDRVVTLCDKVREICPPFPGAASVALHWSMPDPSAEGTAGAATYEAFVRTADEIESRLPFLIADLMHTERSASNEPH